MSTSDSRYIDESQLPFTEEELTCVFALLDEEQDARAAARLLAEHVQTQEHPAWSISAEVFAALALVSDDLRHRVEAYMRAQWEAWRPSLVQAALRREGRSPESQVTLSALRSADDEIAAYVLEWKRRCGVVAEWVARRQAGETPAGELPPWFGGPGE